MNTKMNRSAGLWIWDFAGEYRSRYVLSVLSAVRVHYAIRGRNESFCCFEGAEVLMIEITLPTKPSLFTHDFHLSAKYGHSHAKLHKSS